MKKALLLLCTLLRVLGCALPLAAYHLTRAVLGPAVSTVRLPLSSPESTEMCIRDRPGSALDYGAAGRWKA